LVRLCVAENIGRPLGDERDRQYFIAGCL